MAATTEAQDQVRDERLADRARALSVVLGKEFGIPFRFFRAATGNSIELRGDETQSEPTLSAPEIARLAREERSEVVPLSGNLLEIWLPVPGPDGCGLVAVGQLTALARSPSEAVQERSRLQKWGQAVRDRLRLVDSPSPRHKPSTEPDKAAGRAWEALLGLENLLHNCRLHRQPDRQRRRILHAAADLLGARTLIWAPNRGRGEAIVEGEPILSPWDCGRLADMLTQEPSWRGPGFFLCNDVRSTGWGPQFDRINNLLAIPLPDEDPQGWLVALNKPRPAPATREPSVAGETPDGSATFRRMDVALLSPYAAMFGLMLRSYDRYQSLKDLLVGLTRALTSAIDAKDTYTAGHSERVARVAVVLGQELGMREEELSDIYLAGLLHDIGKIGIRDEVLGKREPLNEEEFAHLRQHVTIGYRILAGTRPIDHLLPGVLYHHERYDGQGYPEGLAGERIPMLARILAVADSYDAMSTTRPYRQALPPEIIEQRLAEGAGTQWDQRVIDAFARCRAKIHAIRHRGVGESLRGALDDAMRHQDSVLSDKSQFAVGRARPANTGVY